MLSEMEAMGSAELLEYVDGLSAAARECSLSARLSRSQAKWRVVADERAGIGSEARKCAVCGCWHVRREM